MDIRQRYGLTIANTQVAELLASDSAASADVDLLRVQSPSAGDRELLRAKGYVVKPAFVTWITQTYGTEDAFVAAQSKSTRSNLRRAQRDVAEAGLRVVIERPVTEAALNDFLVMYEKRIGAMRNGVPIAHRFREEILTEPDTYLGVYAFDGEAMVGGCICADSPVNEVVRIRFSAMSDEWQDGTLSRVLYLSTIEEARNRDYQWASLGEEANLYGHVTMPGLLQFKLALGFRPVASQEFPGGYGDDEADLPVSLRNLDEPTVILGYAPEADRAGDFTTLRCNVFSRATAPDVGRYKSRHLGATETHTVSR